MELFVEKSKGVFNTEMKKGTLIWAKESGWDAGVPGFISAVSEDELVVMFHPDISNVVNHYIIPAKEVAGGKWHIRWSEDMETIHELGREEGVGNAAGGIDQEETPGEPGTDGTAG